MNDAQGPQQANTQLVAQLGPLVSSGFADADADLFADDFVFHFFNSRLPDLAGDHHGLDGLKALFRRLGEVSDTGFHNEPHSLTPFGDELVVAYATNTVSFDGVTIDVDAIIVWRVFDGHIHEAWDIPAVLALMPIRSDQNRERARRQTAVSRLTGHRRTDPVPRPSCSRCHPGHGPVQVCGREIRLMLVVRAIRRRAWWTRPSNVACDGTGSRVLYRQPVRFSTTRARVIARSAGSRSAN